MDCSINTQNQTQYPAHDEVERTVYAVIPVHNRRMITRQCLLCLYQQTFARLKVIVVDDGSSDGTSEMIRAEFPEVILLHGDGNLWWTGATNMGVRYALTQCHKEDYILVINDDVFVQPDYVDTLFNVAESNPSTLVQSVYVDASNVILDGGIRINWITAKWRAVNKGVPLSSFAKGYSCAASTLTGRGTLIPAKVFFEVGLYDDVHFKQCGDTDLPRRAQNAGYQLIVHYDAVVSNAELEANLINTVEDYRWSDWKKYFGDPRSYYNLKDRFWFAYNTRVSILQGITYFLFDLLRISVRFVRGTQRRA